MTTATPQALEAGDDSKAVSPAVKQYVLAAGGGICAAPGCNNRIIVDDTSTGECAHIIPRKVGSGPREDFKTPLEERSKPENLLYLCGIHHDLIDNPNTTDKYPADTIRQWKADHEEWMKGISKKEGFLSPVLKPKFDEFMDMMLKASEEISNSDLDLLEKLLFEAREKIALNLLGEAGALVTVVQSAISNVDNADALRLQIEVLDAVLVNRNDDVHGSKVRLLEILRKHPECVAAIEEYIDICETATDSTDRGQEYETILRRLDSENLRMKITDMARAAKDAAQAKAYLSANPILALPDATPAWLRARYFLQQSLLCDCAEEYSQRDKNLDLAQKASPYWSKGPMFKFLHAALDARRSQDLNDLEGALLKAREQRSVLGSFSPLTRRDHLIWYYNEMTIEWELSRRTGRECNPLEMLERAMEMLLSIYPDNLALQLHDDLLSRGDLPVEILSRIFVHLDKAKVKKGERLTDWLFLQSFSKSELSAQTEALLIDENRIDLRDVLDAVRSKDVSRLAGVLKEKQEEFVLGVMFFLDDPAFSANLAKSVRIGEENVAQLQYQTIMALDASGNSDGAIETLAQVTLEDCSPIALTVYGRLAWKTKCWRLFIPITLELLKFEVPEEFKAILHRKLAYAYHYDGDDTNALLHAETGLDAPQYLTDEQGQGLLCLAAQCNYLLGRPDQACEIFDKYSEVKRDFHERLFEAQMRMHSSDPNKYIKVADLIKGGFAIADRYDDKTYLSSFGVLNDVMSKNPELPIEEAAENSFILLEGIGWLHCGSGPSYGTIVCTSDEMRQAVLGKKKDQTTFWPADKYSAPGKQRTIQAVVGPLAYLAIRSADAIENLAKNGTEPIRTVRVLNDDGTVDIKNLKAFLQEIGQPQSDFFDRYVEGGLPVAFLAAMVGGPAKAIAKIASERKGFIRCNLGSQEDLDRQSAIAQTVLSGAPYVIDALAALVLIEANLLKPLLQAAPSIVAPVSVIRMLRDFATELSPTQMSSGRGGLIDGTVRVVERDLLGETNLQMKLLEGAKDLDRDGIKMSPKPLPKENAELDMSRNLPPAQVDGYFLSCEKSCVYLTDDAPMIQAFAIEGRMSFVGNFSSLSIVRALAEAGHVAWNDYHRFFALLAGYRYHLLPLSVNDLLDAVLPKSKSGLIVVDPERVDALRLDLTLSSDYGVEPLVAIRLMGLFWYQLIVDDTITTEIADSIFAQSIVRFFAGRDAKKSEAEVVCQFLGGLLKRNRWASTIADKKFRHFASQVKEFVETFDPLVLSLPYLIKKVR